MQSLNQVSQHWVHDDSDNVEQDPLPNNYWTIDSEPKAIKIDFVDRDSTVISEGDVRHTKHLEYRHARWDAQSKEEKSESSDES